MSEQDHINSFFQRSLQNGDVDFRAEDWNKMETLLDREERRRPLFYWWRRNRLFAGTGLAVLLVAGILGYLSLHDFQKSPTLEALQQGHDETVSKKTVAPAEKSGELTITNTRENLVIDQIKQPDQPKQAVQQQNQNGGLKNFVNQKFPESVRTDDRSIFSSVRATENSFRIESGKQEVPETMPSQLSHTVISRDAESVAGPSANFLFPIAMQWQEKTNRNHLKPRSTPVVESSGIPGDINPPESRWSLGAVITPEFNAPQLSGTYKGSLTLGGTLRYRFAEKWFVSVGINAGRKYYTGNGTEYHPPKGYWNYRTNGIVPDKVEGYCQMIELPLMIQYRMLKTAQSSLLAGVGMSSYIMKAESYSYQFKNPNPGAESGWSSNSVDSYPFKVFRASISYEYQLSPVISLAAEPHLQIPLQGIGWTNIPLTSIGSSFILRYNFSGR